MLYVLIPICVIILLIVLIFTVPITIKAGYDTVSNEIFVKGRFLCFPFTLAPKSEKKKAKDAAKFEASDDSLDFKEMLEKDGIREVLKFVLSVFKSLWRIVCDVVKIATIKKLTVKIIVSGRDAADTAIGCGWSNAVVCPIVDLIISNAVDYKECEVDIAPDYSDEGETYMEAFVHLNLWLADVIKLIVNNGEDIVNRLKPVMDYIGYYNYDK